MLSASLTCPNPDSVSNYPILTPDNNTFLIAENKTDQNTFITGLIQLSSAILNAGVPLTNTLVDNWVISNSSNISASTAWFLANNVRYGRVVTWLATNSANITNAASWIKNNSAEIANREITGTYSVGINVTDVNEYVEVTHNLNSTAPLVQVTDSTHQQVPVKITIINSNTIGVKADTQDVYNVTIIGGMVELSGGAGYSIDSTPYANWVIQNSSLVNTLAEKVETLSSTEFLEDNALTWVMQNSSKVNQAVTWFQILTAVRESHEAIEESVLTWVSTNSAAVASLLLANLNEFKSWVIQNSSAVDQSYDWYTNLSSEVSAATSWVLSNTANFEVVKLSLNDALNNSNDAISWIEDNQSKITETINWSDRSSAIDTKINTLSTTVNVLTGVAQGAIPVTAWWNSQRQLVDNVAAWVASTTSTWVSQIHIEAVELLFNPFKTWVEENSAALMGLNGVNFLSNSTSTWIETNSSSLTDVDDLKSKFEDILALQQQVDDLRSVIVEFDDTHRWVSDKKQDLQQSVNNLITVTDTVSTANSTIQNITNNIADIKSVIESLNTSTDLNTTTTTAVQDWLTENSASIVAVNSWALQASTTLINLVESNKQSSKSQVDFSVLSGWFKQNTNKLDSLLGSDVATNAQVSEINKQLAGIESSLQQIKGDEAMTWVASNSANLLEIISQVVSTRDLTKNVNSWVVSKSAELTNTLLTFNDLTTKVATISDINGKVTSLITNVNGIELKLPIYDNLVSWVTSSSSTLKNTAETVNVLLRSKQITENTFTSVQSSISNLTNIVNNTVVDVKDLTAWTVNVSSTIDAAFNEANKLNVKLLETSNEIENLNTSNSTLIKDISFLRLSAAAENNKTKDALASHNLQIQELKDVSEKSIKDIDLLVVSKTSTDQNQTAISQRVEVLSKNVDTLTVNVENLVKNVSNSKLESQKTLTEIDSLKKSISNLLVNSADTPSSASTVDTGDISTKVTTVTEGLNTLKTVVDSLLRERSNITSTKDSIANTIEELRSHFNNITGEQAKALSTLQSTVEGIDASTKNITTDIGTFNSTLINTISDVEDIKQSLQDLQKTQSTVVELNQKVKTLSSNIPVLESKINELDSNTKDTLAQTKSVAEKVTETTCVIEKAVGDIEILKSSDTKKSFDIVNVKNDVSSIKQANVAVSVRLDNVENNTTNLTKTVTELEDQVLKSTDISSIAFADIASLKQQQSNVNETITKVIVETKNLKQDVISNTAVLQDTVKVISNNINSIIADVTLLKNTPATQSLSVESFDDSELNGNINTVKTAINSLLTDLNKLKESSQQIGNKLSEVENNTQLNVTVVGNRFKDTQANVDAVVSTVSKLETDITSTKLTTSSILDTLNKLKGVDLDTLNRVEAVKGVVAALTGRISEVEALISNINSAELTELHNQNEKLKIEVAGVKLTTIDIKDNLNKVSSDLAKTKIDLQDLKTQQDSNTPTNDNVLASTLDDVVKLKDDQQSTAAELVNLKGILSVVDAKNKEVVVSIVKDLVTVKDSTQNIATDVNTLKVNLNKLEEKAEQNNSSLSRIVTDLKATDIKISSDIKEIKNSVSNIPQIDLTDKISSIDNSINKLEQELDSTKNVQNTLSVNLDTTSSNVGNIASELNTIKVLASKSNVDVIKLKELSDNLRKDINNINTLVDESFNIGKSTNNNTQGTISTLVTNLTTLQSKVDSINNDILKLKALNIKDSTQSITADISNEPLNTNILNDIDELKKSLNLVQDSVNTLTASVEGNLKNIKVVLNETNNNTKKTTEKLVIDSITLLEGKIQNTIDSVATTVQTLTASISELTIKCNRDISTLSKEVDDIKLKVRVSLDTIKADTNTSVTNAKIDINSSIEALKLETEASLDALRVNTETSIDDVKALVDTNKVEASALVETLRVNTKTSIDNLKTNVTETIKSITPSIDSVKIETESIKNTLSTLQVETHNSLESVKSNTNASINAVKSAVDDVKTSIVELKNNNSLKSIVITDNKDASELLNAVKADILTSIDVVKADTQVSIEAVKVDTKTAIDSVKAETTFIKSTLNTNKTDTQTSIDAIKSSIDTVKADTQTSIEGIKKSTQTSVNSIKASIENVEVNTQALIETVKADNKIATENIKVDTQTSIEAIKSSIQTVTKASIESLKADTKLTVDSVKSLVDNVKNTTQTSINSVKVYTEDLKTNTQASLDALTSSLETVKNVTQASVDSVKADTHALIDNVKAETALVKASLNNVKAETKTSLEAVKADTLSIIDTIKDDTKASIDAVKSSLEAFKANKNNNSFDIDKAEIQTSIQNIKAETALVKASLNNVKAETKTSLEAVKTTLEAVKTDTLSSVESVKAETESIVSSLNTVKSDTKASIDTVKSLIDSVTASVEDIKSSTNTSLVKFSTSLVNDVENLKSASAVNVSFVTKAYNTTTENTVSINLLKEKITAVIEDILTIKEAIANTTVTTSLPETITNVITVSGDAVDLKPIILSVENLKAFNLKLNSDISTLRESNLKLSSKIDNTEKGTLNQSQALETLSVSNESIKKTLEDIKVLTSKSITDTSKLSIDNNKTSAELEGVRSSIKLLTTNLNNIKSAIDYTDVIEKLKTANNNIESLVSKLQTSVNELNDKVEKLDKNNQLTNTAVAVVENNLNSLKQDIKENTDAAKINTRIDLVVDQVSNNLVSNKQTTEKLDANIKVVELVSNKISSEVSVLKNKETATSTKLEDLTNYTQTSLKDINNTLKSVNSISDKVDLLATKTADTTSIVDVKVSTISNAITTLRTDIDTVKKSVQEISTKYDELKKATKEATSTLTVAQTPIVEDKNNCVLVDDKINTVIQTVNFLKDYTNKLTTDLLSVKTSNTKLATDLVTLKAINQTPTFNDTVVIDQLTQQVNTLNETVNSLADSSVITSTVQELSNKLQKLTNTLDLVRIDVSSSQNNAVLTKALQTRVNSVVENVDSSKELVVKLSVQANKLDEQITDISNTVKNALTRIELLEANTSTHKDQISKNSCEIQAINTAVSILARTSQVANNWVAANAEKVNTALAKLNKIEDITETIQSVKSGVDSNNTSILNNTAWITSAGKSVETWISTASSKLNAISTWIDSNNSIVPQKSNLAITAWFDANSAALEQTLTWVAYLTTLEERSAVTAKISNNTETLYGLTSAEEWVLANSNDTLQVVSWVMANSAGILNRTAAGNVALSLATTNNTWLTANSAVLQGTSSWTTQNSSLTNTVRTLTTWLTANSSIVTNLNDAVQSVQNSLYNNTTWINSSAVRLNSTATWVNSNSSRILQGVSLAESYHSDYDYSKQFIADNAQNILQWNSWLASNNQKLTQVATWVSILTAVREQHEWLEDAVFNWVQVNSASPLFTSNLDVTNWVVYNSADIAAVQAWYGSVKDNLDTYGRWVFEHLADLHSTVTWVNANSSQIQSTQSNVFKTLMYATSANEWINYNSDRLLNTTSWLTTNSTLIASSLKATDWFVKSNTDGPAALNWVISNSAYINDAAQWMHLLSGITETHEHLEDQVFAWVQTNSDITWVATWIQVNSALLFDVCTWVQSHSARFDDIDTFIDSNSSTIIGATVWTMSNSADILDADQWVFANRDNLDALYTHYAPISERVINAVDWVETNGIPVVNATNWVIKWNERVEAATEWVEQFSGVVENTVVWAAANSAHYDQAYAWVTTGSVEVRNLRSNVDYLLTATEPSIAWFERFRSMWYVVCANSGVDVANGGSLWSTDTFGGDGGGDCAPCRWERNDGITVPVGMLEYGDVYKHEDGKGWTAIEILEKMLYGSRLRITQHPQSLIINPGTTITFETSATGTGTITYQWYFVPTDGTIDIVPSALDRILNVPNATYPQEGQYVAIVSNGLTTLTSNFATLEVNKPVEITVDPISQKVYTPTGFTLYATLTGTLPISYRWYRNDVAISLPSSITTNNQRNISFGLNPSTTSLSGDYKLSASNIVNVDTSTAVITIIDPVVITLNPISRQLALYESITLTSAATGTEPITYQWYTLNGSASTIISGATTTSLIDITANGTYFMMASNDGGLRTARSANAIITHEALRNIGITLHPASSTINPNWYPLSAYTMSVAATGDAPITYQWYLSTIQDPLILIADATSTQLTVTAGGTYFARASNDFSWAQSNLATIAVRIPPTITLNPLSLSAYDGDLVTFNANASGTETITYRWFRNNVSISTNATGKNYTFTARVSDSGAQYHIVATGPFQLGSVSSTDATVDIKQHLAITQQPANIVTNPDQTVTFSVAATGTPTITYQWYFIQNGGTTLQLLNGKVDVNNELQNVTTINEGQYVAIVTNGIETLTSNFATLEITKPVEIVIDPLPQTIYVPYSFTLNAAVTGTYPIYYKWLRNTGDGYTPISNVIPLYSPTASAISFTVTNTTTALSGMYKISAYNVVNTDESEALVTIIAPVSVTIAPITTTLHYGYGNEVTLSATPAGTPPFTYQWYTLAGSVSTLIAGQQSTTYTTGNSGTYFVRASNAGGARSAKSNNAAVNYDFPVKVTSISTNKSKVYTPNETFTVTGTITGSNVITYQWIRTTNGVSTTVGAISTTTGTAVSSFGSSKTITATTTALSGTYTLSAYNSFSSDASAVNVAIIEPVGVTIVPTASTINDGDTIDIKTDILSGTPPYTLQWYKKTTPTNTLLAGATGTTYTATDSGTYFVMASNDTGMRTATSNDSVITERERLKITYITANQKVYTPNTIHVHADVSGSLPITYRWRRVTNGVTTWLGTDTVISTVEGKTGIPLTVAPSMTSLSGTYSLSAINSVNSDLSSTFVTVIEPVTITISPTLTTLHYGSGSTTVITAVTGGTPPVNVQWYSVVNTVSTAINGETGITYTTGNSGTYFAKASNDGGLKTAVSNNAVVTYDFPVKVTAISNSAPKVYTPNGTFTVTGTVTGSNAITYKWVRATNGTSTVLGTSSTTGTSVTSFNSSYTVLATNTNLSGVYTLSAYNSFSSDASAVNAVIIDPVYVTITPASQTILTGTSATISVLALTGTPPYTLQWYKDPSTLLTGVTSNSYTTSAAGTYFVVASNDTGMKTATSNNAVIALSTANQTYKIFWGKFFNAGDVIDDAVYNNNTGVSNPILKSFSDTAIGGKFVGGIKVDNYPISTWPERRFTPFGANTGPLKLAAAKTDAGLSVGVFTDTTFASAFATSQIYSREVTEFTQFDMTFPNTQVDAATGTPWTYSFFEHGKAWKAVGTPSTNPTLADREKLLSVIFPMKGWILTPADLPGTPWLGLLNKTKGAPIQKVTTVGDVNKVTIYCNGSPVLYDMWMIPADDTEYVIQPTI